MSRTYKLDPASAQTFGGTSLTSCNSVSWEDAADEVLLNTDGSRFIGGAFVDNKYYRVTVSLAEPISTVKSGQTGNLVLKTAPRANGDGVGTAVTLTFTGAVCVSAGNQVNHGGVSDHSIVFVVPGVAGAGVYTDPLAVT